MKSLSQLSIVALIAGLCVFAYQSRAEEPSHRFTGSSIADEQLQKDALPVVIIAATAFLKAESCKTYSVSYAQLTKPPESRPSDKITGTVHGVWEEEWMINMCGKLAVVPVTFIPDNHKTDFVVKNNTIRAIDEDWYADFLAAGKEYESGDYAQSEVDYKNSLTAASRAGVQPLELAVIQNNMAALYLQQAKYGQAQELLEQTLQIQDQIHTVNPDSLSSTLDNLACAYYLQGKYEQAEPLFQRALKFMETTYGPDHTKTASLLNAMGESYRLQHNYKLAEPLYRRSIAIYEKTSGPDSPEMMTAINNLSLALQEQGKFSESEPLAKQAISILEKTLGVDHPNLAKPYTNLGLLYFQEKKFALAESYFTKALTLDKKAFGPDHINVAGDLANLAFTYHAENKPDLAQTLFKQSLEIYQKAYGPDHEKVRLIQKQIAQTQKP